MDSEIKGSNCNFRIRSSQFLKRPNVMNGVKVECGDLWLLSMSRLDARHIFQPKEVKVYPTGKPSWYIIRTVVVVVNVKVKCNAHLLKYE